MKKCHGDFPELSKEENEVIYQARNAGYASFFPCYPDSATQARNTLAGAEEWLKGENRELVDSSR